MMDIRAKAARERCAACRNRVSEDPSLWDASTIGVVCAQCLTQWATELNAPGASYDRSYGFGRGDMVLRKWARDKALRRCAAGCGAATCGHGWLDEVMGIVCPSCSAEAKRDGMISQNWPRNLGAAIFWDAYTALRKWADDMFDRRKGAPPATPWSCLMPSCRGRENNAESKCCFMCGNLRPCAAAT